MNRRDRRKSTCSWSQWVIGIDCQGSSHCFGCFKGVRHGSVREKMSWAQCTLYIWSAYLVVGSRKQVRHGLGRDQYAAQPPSLMGRVRRHVEPAALY
jgi:hypothetical protein